MRPETRYALSGDVSIAYQVVGERASRSRTRTWVRLDELEKCQRQLSDAKDIIRALT